VGTHNKENMQYSEIALGDEGNFQWPIRMDQQDGYLGITQFASDGTTVEARVLLVPFPGISFTRLSRSRS